MVTDISERKRLERSLQQAKTHMEEFTYVASHDLKSPLRGIADLVEWVEEDLPENASPALHNNLERIKLRIARMEKLVDDLLLYARAGKHSGDMSPVDLRELIKGIIDLHPVPAGFVVNTHIDLPLITAARTPLETVLRNLFSNAIKHHDGQGEPRLDISVRAYGNNALFSFRDNGPGVPEAAQERIFRLFQTLSNNKQSSGIGLALAKRMSESHGGHIELVCNPGQRGVEFRVYWPRFARKDNVE